MQDGDDEMSETLESETDQRFSHLEQYDMQYFHGVLEDDYYHNYFSFFSTSLIYESETTMKYFLGIIFY